MPRQFQRCKDAYARLLSAALPPKEKAVVRKAEAAGEAACECAECGARSVIRKADWHSLSTDAGCCDAAPVDVCSCSI